ncbi:hypothetical protein ACQKE0_07915 [Shewanella colwelliana]|uniref:Uncharacterized protein n=1 Tax=Shewanella colwelliana TaxID=23 RepID=A0ABQ4NY04_SHECO|nr:hypothetical protein [Shewanella colwelliana]GIU39618.1 hypothetical protein TUM3794_15080 [Shewanella colwelliana]
MIRKIALFILAIPFTVNASAPFGLTWGAPLQGYGEIVENASEQVVTTHTLPKGPSIARYYELYGTQAAGLLKVMMQSGYYSQHSSQFDDDFNFIKASLINIGYHTTESKSSELSSYKCVFQGHCIGKRWYGRLDDNTSAFVVQQAPNRNEQGSIQVIFKSPEQIALELARADALAERAESQRANDELAFD